MCFHCYGNFHILIMGKVEIGIYFRVTAGILKKVLLKCFWSSSLPTIWILSKSMILIGGHGNRKAKFSRERKKKKNIQKQYHINLVHPNCWIWLLAMANERLIFLACNIYSIFAEYSHHSCTFSWALWPTGLWFFILQTNFFLPLLWIFTLGEPGTRCTMG